MARRFKKKYSSFHRQILGEVMTAKQLSDLDHLYSQAKVRRVIKRVAKELAVPKDMEKIAIRVWESIK